MQSLLLHEAAVALLRAEPALANRLLATLDRWALRNDVHSHVLHERWREIIQAEDWDAALARDEGGQQLRQASPLATLLSGEQRLAVMQRAKALRGRG